MAAVLLDNYTNLQNAIAKWLNRDDLVDYIPSFIVLAEAEIDRVLRRTVVRATITVNSQATALGSGVAELRSIRLITSSGSRDTVFEVVTPEMLAEHRAGFGNVAGRPRFASVIAGQLVVAPDPDTAYTAEIIYYGSLIKLSDTNAANVILTEAPDLYLYGALKASAPFLKDDERLGIWTSLADNALQQLHNRREREEHGANLRPMRLPVVFGTRP